MILELESLKFLCVIVLNLLKNPLIKNEIRHDSSLILMKIIFTVIKTMLMYFCEWFSWP